ncbi:hypothetical protein [Nonomuraea zeae]|uniref:hypothetical protein n=1 Tax=Nonomuraea zeae TaxID=1642303 RepID=UPI001981B20A|nr:hypothetical protein [Nonomuraea zeae]
MSLGLPPEDFVIAGSGPLLAHGIKPSIGDLDVVARGKAWAQALSLGTPASSPFGEQVEKVQLLDGRIEIFNGWFPEAGTVDDLIARSEVIDGLRYESLADVCRWKRNLDRPKDRADLELIERYTSGTAADQGSGASAPQQAWSAGRRPAK